MTSKSSFMIRDGLSTDIDACLTLNHSYETDYVWQVNMQDIGGEWRITLREDRLPRPMTITYPVSQKRLHHALKAEHGFLVATSQTDNHVLGYLTITVDAPTQTATIRDVVVDLDYRHRGIALRLLRVARHWAAQHNCERLQAETQTINYPAIQLYKRAGYRFCGFNDQHFANQDIAVYFSQTIR